VCYLVNQSPSTTINCKILEEVWKSHSCDYSNMIFLDVMFMLLFININVLS
jgi:hypothetical protein